MTKPLTRLVPTLEQYCQYHEWRVQKAYEARIPTLVAQHEAEQLAKGDVLLREVQP